MPRSNSVRAPQLLSLRFRPREQKLLKPRHPRAHALRQEKPLQREAHGLQLQSSPCSPPLEKSLCSNVRPSRAKIYINKQNYTDTKGTLEPWEATDIVQRRPLKLTSTWWRLLSPSLDVNSFTWLQAAGERRRVPGGCFCKEVCQERLKGPFVSSG